MPDEIASATVIITPELEAKALTLAHAASRRPLSHQAPDGLVPGGSS
jgi:hypothetical protein